MNKAELMKKIREFGSQEGHISMEDYNFLTDTIQNTISLLCSIPETIPDPINCELTPKNEILLTWIVDREQKEGEIVVDSVTWDALLELKIDHKGWFEYKGYTLEGPLAGTRHVNGKWTKDFLGASFKKLYPNLVKAQDQQEIPEDQV